MMKPANPKYRVLYAFWAFMEVIGFGGLIFGWGSLVYILKDEGLYMELCSSDNITAGSSTMNGGNVSRMLYNAGATNSTGAGAVIITQTRSTPVPTTTGEEDNSCDARDARLNLVFTIGSAMFCVGCFIFGQINYKFGTRVSRVSATVTFIIGALLIAFTSNEVPWLIFPGLSFIGGAGITFLVTNMQISLLFPKMGSVVVGIFCGGFDASTGTQLLVKLGYENGISRQTSFIVLGIAHLLSLVSTFLFLPKDFIKKPPALRTNETALDEKDKEVEIKLTSNGNQCESEETDLKPSLMSQMCSWTYILHVYWLSVLQLRFYFLLGSLNTMLENMLDSKDDVSRYTNETTYILMCGLFTSPLAGAFYALQNRFFANSLSPLRRNLMPTVIPLVLTCVLGILMSAVILIEKASVIYAVFVCLLFFRSFLYTMAAGLLSAIFPSEYFGIMYGIMFIVSGMVSMLQYGLFAWADAAGFFQVNIFLLILMFTTFCHPMYQWWASNKAERSLSF